VILKGQSAMTTQSEVGTITRLVAKHAREAFQGPEAIASEWQALNFTAAPDFARAVDEYDGFLELLRRSGCEITMLPKAQGAGLDSIYVRDASVVCDRGVILCNMGKPQRVNEPAAQGAALRTIGCAIVGSIQPPGRLEGGDVVWLDERTIAVGRGYRTNDAGIAQLRAFLGDGIDELLTVPLPHWRGAGDVFHLMSIISPVDRDLAVVYSPLMPVPFRERLMERSITLVEVPDQEFDSMAANVLAIAPRRCVMVAGNPITRARLEAAGAQVFEYEGKEISLKGGGGPTCLTRPLERRK
jgi:N-dimethylarginine dimethylaminohydrolase